MAEPMLFRCLARPYPTIIGTVQRRHVMATFGVDGVLDARRVAAVNGVSPEGVAELVRSDPRYGEVIVEETGDRGAPLTSPALPPGGAEGGGGQPEAAPPPKKRRRKKG